MYDIWCIFFFCAVQKVSCKKLHDNYTTNPLRIIRSQVLSFHWSTLSKKYTDTIRLLLVSDLGKSKHEKDEGNCHNIFFIYESDMAVKKQSSE